MTTTAQTPRSTPNSGSNWTGDEQLEPLLNSLHTTFRGQLTERECVQHLQKAAWRLDVANLHAKLDIRDRDIKAKREHIDELNKQVVSFAQGRSAHDDVMRANSMDIMDDYVQKLERQLRDASDTRTQELMGQLAEMEASKIASDNKIDELRQELSMADDRQTAACATLEAQVKELKREIMDLEALRDTNRHLDSKLTELSPGGRACKMLVADANECPLAMIRAMWMLIGTDVWEDRNEELQSRIAAVVQQELEAARTAHAKHTRQLFQSTARSQSLAASLNIPAEVKHLEEEAVEHATGPADVFRIANDIEALRHAEEDCEDWSIKASRRLKSAESGAAGLKRKLTDMEHEMQQMEEEHPGIFEQKEDDELLEEPDKGGECVGMSEEERRGAELLRLVVVTRKDYIAAEEELEAAQDEVAQAQLEASRITAALTALLDERRYWFSGPDLRKRFGAAEKRRVELESLYGDALLRMAPLHTKIRFLWSDRLGHRENELRVEFMERPKDELIPCAPKSFFSANRMIEDLDKLVAQRLKDVSASRRRYKNMVRDLKSRQWDWNRGQDKLHGWEHDEALRALLTEVEPDVIDGLSSETTQARLEWCRNYESRLRQVLESPVGYNGRLDDGVKIDSDARRRRHNGA